jgi:hypothetical protein
VFVSDEVVEAVEFDDKVVTYVVEDVALVVGESDLAAEKFVRFIL